MNNKSEKIELSIRDIIQQTADTITVHFMQPERKLIYLSGQFLTLIAKIEEKEERRSYSLCSSAAVDKDLSVTIKRVKGGKMSNYLNNNLKAGNTIRVLPPMGNFKFDPKNCQRQIVLIAGGSGITPLFSILKSALIEKPSSAVTLIYVNSNKENTIFYKEIEQWSSKFSSRFRTVYYWSDAIKNTEHKPSFWQALFKKNHSTSHRLNPKRLNGILNDLGIRDDLENTGFYICGPAVLMEMAKATILESGFSKDLIYTENFCTALTTRDTQKDAWGRRIKIRLNGNEKELQVPAGSTILSAGLESGIDLPYSCQSGNCVSCIGRSITGSVEMLPNEVLTREQIKEGHVLTCIGYPKSDDVIIEFT